MKRWTEWETTNVITGADGKVVSFSASRHTVVGDGAVIITRLHPGEAYGARDLQNWSTRRNGGKFGVFDRKAYKEQRKHAKALSNAAGRKVKEFK